MFPPHILVAGQEQISILFCQLWKLGNRNKLVPTKISDFVFHVSFFPSGLRIHEYGLKTVMLIETSKAIRHLPSAAFNDLGDNCAGVVKPDFPWDTADMLEYGL